MKFNRMCSFVLTFLATARGTGTVLYSKMAANGGEICVKDVMVPLRLLTSIEQTKCANLLEVKGKNSFDELLKQKLLLLQNMLANDTRLPGLEDIKNYLAECFILKSCVLSSEYEIDDRNRPEGDEILNQKVRKQEDVNLQKSKEKTSVVINGVTTKSHSVRWTFAQVCLRMISYLREVLQCSKNTERVGKAASMDLFSVNDQKVVATVVQFVVVLGICPNLLPGVGIPIERRSGFSHVLSQDSVENSVRCPKCLYQFTITLVKCLGQPSLSMLILSRHLGDILSSLLQLAYSCEMRSGENDVKDTSFSECQTTELWERTEFYMHNNLHTSALADSDKACYRSHKEGVCVGNVLISPVEWEECAKALQNIVDNMYQPLVVRELLFLQGGMSGQKPHAKKTTLKGRTPEKLQENLPSVSQESKSPSRTPPWMKEVCGHLLSKCLMKKSGIQNILRGVLESASGKVMWLIALTCQLVLK